MLERLRRFFYGRNGTDQLALAMMVVGFLLWIAGNFTAYWYLWLIGFLPLGYSIFRTFSRNIEKRRRENATFLKMIWPFRSWYKDQGRNIKDKTHKYYKCPKCHATLRVPRGKGNIVITCAKCRYQFMKKT